MPDTRPLPPPTELASAQADLNAAAERIWEAASPACPELSIEVLPEVGSTNTELMARGRRGEVSPTLLTAVAQTAGRGRHGRVWQAAPGASLSFSLGLPLQLDAVPGGGSALSLAVGLALAESLDAMLAAAWAGAPGTTHTQADHGPGADQASVVGAQRAVVGLKWPNDLWLGGGKLGGVLIEASPAPGLPEGQRWVVIGVGLNLGDVAQAPPGSAALRQAWPAHAAPLCSGQVWSGLAPRLLARVRAFAAEGFAPLLAAYQARDVLAGQPVALWTAPGQGPADGHPPSQTGLAHGVSGDGALLVHTEAGLQAWRSGEVSVRLQPH
jgi:BirA family biotin operon repressor/biotin-[acetyl-CoA-carboxylase] ligase